MARRQENWGRTLVFALVVLSASSARADQPKPGKNAPAKKLALLVGCGEYPLSKGNIKTLRGAVNDVGLWAKTLTDPKGFAFPAADVTQLVGWPTDPGRRPTRDNIVAAFKSLLDRAGPGTQIFILLAGHGTQQPIPDTQEDPLDPANPEPDGLDEVFLPADAMIGKTGIVNGIKDDEIGVWLQALRAKGAAVCIVFDCCHSGTMTRGNDDDVMEVSRSVDASVFTSQALLDAAVNRARNAVQKKASQGQPIARDLPRIVPKKDGPGALVAFYAAQPFEPAPELPLPEGVPHTPEHFHGLLSYTLVQALEGRRSALSYGELARIVSARYRACRGTRYPTPFAEGDLAYEVLGLNRWPERDGIVLGREGNKLRLNAGAVRGLTPGTILAVHPPAGAGGNSKDVLGHVRVESVSALHAFVEPVAHDGHAVLPAGKIEDSSDCTVVSRDFGDLRIKLFVEDAPALRDIFGKLDKEVTAMIRPGVKEAEADWLLRVATPKQAHTEFGLAEGKEPRVLLLQNVRVERQAEERLVKAGHALPRRVFANYASSDIKLLIHELERDLPRVFKWQNLWRVASDVAAQQEDPNGLKFEVAKLKDKLDRTGGEVLRSPVLRDGQDIEIRLKNEGIDDLWVALFFLDANLGIKQYWAGSIGQGRALKPFRATVHVEGDSFGAEGLVVFALPIKEGEPDFRFLEQEPLQVPQAVRRGGTPPQTPFGRLLAAAAFDQGTRNLTPHTSTTPTIQMRPWLLLPRR